MASGNHTALIESYGFKCRQSLDGKRCSYRTPPPRSHWLERRGQVELYLKAMHTEGKMLDLTAAMFSFGKRKMEVAGKEMGRGPGCGAPSNDAVKTTQELLSKDPGVVLDHRQILNTTAKKLDKFLTERLQSASPECVEVAKSRVTEAMDERSLLASLMSDSKLAESLASEVVDLQVSEVASIKGGPLAQFPPDVNQNLYSAIVEWAMEHTPISLAHAAGLATRRDRPILPRDIVVVASALANNTYLVNHNINAVIQLRSWISQAEGLHDMGLDRLSACNLVSPARTLNQQKDVLTEQGQQLVVTSGKKMPRHYVLDNVDIGGEHLMLKVSALESFDTSALSTVGLTKEEALLMFNKDLVLMSSPARAVQRNQLLEMLYFNWGAEIAEYGGERTAKLKKLLAGKHRHTLSEERPKPTVTFIEKLYPCQETSHSDMIKLLVKVQREHLEQVFEFKEREPRLKEAMVLLESRDAETEDRLGAEKYVHEANAEYGFFRAGAGTNSDYLSSFRYMILWF